MFKGFRKEAPGKPKRPSPHTIDAKRSLVIASIDGWLAVLNGERLKGVHRLSQVDGDRRLVWMKYAKQHVPLNDAGDLVGEIDIEQNETEFWSWMKTQVSAGTYDKAILQIAETVRRRLQPET